MKETGLGLLKSVAKKLALKRQRIGFRSWLKRTKNGRQIKKDKSLQHLNSNRRSSPIMLGSPRVTSVAPQVQ